MPAGAYGQRLTRTGANIHLKKMARAGSRDAGAVAVGAASARPRMDRVVVEALGCHIVFGVAEHNRARWYGPATVLMPTICRWAALALAYAILTDHIGASGRAKTLV
ncbi:hypothetical protein GCM10022251_33510 [Phytohabitans flavus]|uniref:Uncharacterized protein n=1 Tax=Phytohabitans flavus TaxID=1076124 RepID=A0A6F8XN82_9ACTN|nr:hypothetical protein Pflav_017040 [Phytohabitans flavus]